MRHETLFRSIVAFAAFSLFALASPALAQSTSGVSGADVKAGDDSFEYRFSASPEDDGKEEGFNHRFHYQHAFDGSWRGRLIVSQGKRGAEALTTQSVSIEILKQFLESENTGGWDSAIRVDGLIPTEDGRPGRARIAWLNGVELDDHLDVRANIYFGREFGNLAKDGVSVETREELTYKLDSGIKIGAQMLNGYGTTAHFGSFDSQKHQLGPVIKGNVGKHVKYELGALFGLSRAASDADVRLFISYAL
jgi:hypothetical protein